MLHSFVEIKVTRTCSVCPGPRRTTGPLSSYLLIDFGILIFEFVLLAIESQNAIGARRKLLELKCPLRRDPGCGEAARGIRQRDAIDVWAWRHPDAPDNRHTRASARRHSRHAVDGPVDRGAIVAQHDVNGKTRAAGADYKRLAQEIGAARDRRCDISAGGSDLEPIAAGPDVLQHEIVVVGLARWAKGSESTRIEIVGGLQIDVSLLLAGEASPA